MKDSGFQWIGNIPDGWDIIRLKYVSRFKTGSTPPNKVGISDVPEKSIPWYTAPDFSENFVLDETGQYISNEIVNIFKVKVFPKDTILLVCIASVGKIGITKYVSYSNQQITGIMPYDIYPKYLLYMLSSQTEKIQKDASANVVPIINTQYLTNIPVTIPTVIEQKLIANFLDEKCNNIDNIINDLEKQIEVLEKYKKSVITEAVTKGLNSDVELKDSGINWIGEIPNHWNTTKMKFSSYMKGRIGWQGLTSNEYIDEGPYLVTGTDFKNGAINWESCVHVAEDRYKIAPEIMLKEFDLLITKDGTVGKVAIVNNLPDKATLNSGVLLIRPIVSIYEIKYLYYVLISKQFWDWFGWINNGGTTIIHLYQNVFNNFVFTLPPIEEQKQIINLLDKKVIEIDSIIEDKMNQVETIKKYKSSLIYEYVTGKKRVSQGDVNE